MGKNGENGAVVKIDSILLSKVEDFIKMDENRLKFTNKKQFIDLAVDEYLNGLIKKQK